MQESLNNFNEFLIPIGIAIGGAVTWAFNWYYALKKKNREEVSDRRREKNDIVEVYKNRALDAERREIEAMSALQEMAPKLKEVYEKHVETMDRLGKAEVSLSMYKSARNEIISTINRIESCVSDDDEYSNCDIVYITENIESIKSILTTIKDA